MLTAVLHFSKEPPPSRHVWEPQKVVDTINFNIDGVKCGGAPPMEPSTDKRVMFLLILLF